ncbi:MAG: Ribonuclease 3 [Holosporales bacterium]
MFPKIKNERLKEGALTHPSFNPKKRTIFERLEFLGDRVLGLIISEELVCKHPKDSEGALAKKLSKLVSKDVCRAIYIAIEGDKHLKANPKELKMVTSHIYSDACEALLGALYLDQGLREAKKFVTQHWGPYIDEKVNLDQDYKTRLQEWVQKHYNQTPVYELQRKSGTDHQPEFTVTVTIPQRKPVEGVGPTMRMAEKSAALSMLKVLDLI